MLSGEGKVISSLEYELQSVLNQLTILHHRQSQNRSHAGPLDFDALTNAVFDPDVSRTDPDSALIRSL